ncbi:MAG: excinuclease ABC subunit UvrA [Thermotogae bacterium]|nr:excinuclease ABC subunit UvrA [Thermotogota bacterium]
MDWIKVRGARENNLKNIDVDIPKNKIVVISGLSGSGKSTLAMDTIYAEGQRRYLESVSSYARQFLGDLKKPDVESIEGLSPAIAIEQKSVSHNPRSTVGTTTEIYDYIRVLYARVGEAYCPHCHIKLKSSTTDEIIENIYSFFKDDSRIYILSNIAREKKGEFRKEIEAIKSSGFKRVEIDKTFLETEELLPLKKTVRHNINILIDRLKLRKDNFERLYEAIELGLKEGNGFIEVRNVDENEKTLSFKVYSENMSCPKCGYAFPEVTPKMFSFNSPFGACEECHGLGFKLEVEPSYIFDMSKSIISGALLTMGKNTYMVDMISQLIEFYGEKKETPIKELSKSTQEYIFYGTKDAIPFKISNEKGKIYEFKRKFEGIVNWYERRYSETESPEMRSWLESNVMTHKTCQKCKGKRLKEDALSVYVGDKNINEITDFPLDQSYDFFQNLKLNEFQSEIAGELLREIKLRIKFLIDVGLNYITLSRTASTLSGGEAQRVRLATQIGSGLTGVTYVLDEPTIGLHPRDNDRLIKTLDRLRDLGNTVIIVEHDEEVIKNSDYIVDIGPGAGLNGGNIIFSGNTEELLKKPGNSLTGQYITGIKKIEIFDKKRVKEDKTLVLRGAKHNNLKNIDLEIPLGKFISVTGVSGSGKSSLIMDTLYQALLKELKQARALPGEYDKIEGIEYIDNVISIDQSPIGRTPRSNPATYTGIFDLVRNIFESTPEAKMRGYSKGRFSFNVKGGRCEACSGNGVMKIEMQFLPDVFVTCDVCKGKRYNSETLKVKYKNKNISDILEMSVDEGVEFFKNISSIHNVLSILQDVGLGYIKLGQPATTLSGGEAQRIKLTSELRKRSTGRTVYILDEPTTGLHFEDVKKLISVLNLLVEKGNTVIVIEHNLDVIKNSDYIIDVGPEGGDNGGKIIAKGSPEDFLKYNTHTAEYLKKIIK